MVPRASALVCGTDRRRVRRRCGPPQGEKALELQRQESQRLAIAKTTVDVAASLLAAIEDV